MPLRWILLAGAIHASIYIFSVPPWQHYDEPGQFEFAWLIAHHASLPKPGDFDPAADQAIAESMQTHHFGAYTVSGYPILGVNQPSAFGGSQVDWQSAYYIIVSLPLRLLGGASIDLQLYAARIVSASMFLLTLIAAFGLMSEWTVASSRLRWLAPLGMALLPGFVDSMTSVNNDVGAAMGVTFSLWVAVRLIRRGLSIRMAVAAILLGLFCVWVKVTAYVAVPVLFLALVLSMAGGKYRPFGYVSLALAGLTGFLAVMGWGDAQNWMRLSDQPADTRVETKMATVGDAAFHLVLDAQHPIAGMAQPLPYEDQSSNLNTVFTMGAWIWCSKPPTNVAFGLVYGYESHIFHTTCTQEPVFATYTIPPIAAARNIWVYLYADQITAETVDVYYDGLVLVNGSWPESRPPIFDDSSARSGVWDGRPFVNMLRNPSAEVPGPRFAGWVDRMHLWNTYPSTIMQSAIDLPGSWNYFFLGAKAVFQTFWAKFSWGRVALLGGAWAYYALAIISALGCFGACLLGLRQPRIFFSSEGFVTAVAVVVTWGMVLLRGVSSLVGFLVIPTAHYTYPVLLPTLLVLLVGWRELAMRARIPPRVSIMVGTAAFVSFDIFSLYSQWFYYASFGLGK